MLVLAVHTTFAGVKANLFPKISLQSKLSPLATPVPATNITLLGTESPCIKPTSSISFNPRFSLNSAEPCLEYV
jgi:hypothetical protein